MNIAKRMKVLIKLFQKFAGDWGQRPQGLNRRSREEKARAVVIPGRRPVNKGPDGFLNPTGEHGGNQPAQRPIALQAHAGLGLSLFSRKAALCFRSWGAAPHPAAFEKAGETFTPLRGCFLLVQRQQHLPDNLTGHHGTDAALVVGRAQLVDVAGHHIGFLAHQRDSLSLIHIYPDPYMDALNQWGLPWQIDENPALVD